MERKDTGTGSFVPAAGATVASSLLAGSVGSSTGATCTTTITNASGQCAVIARTRRPAGSNRDCSSAVCAGGLSLTRATGDSVGQDGPNNTKTWVDAKITLDGNST